MVFLAILTGILSLGNYYVILNNIFPTSMLIINTVAQLIFTVLTILAAVGYKGRKEVYGYKGYNIWTFRFAIIMFSLLGNICILGLILLNMFGVVNTF